MRVPAPLCGPDTLGHLHRHNYTIPWRGYLMCEELMCAAVSDEGYQLTPVQEEEIRFALSEKYGGDL